MRRALVSSRFLFVVLAFFSLFLLLASRSGEVRTVWEVMNPWFLPVFFVVTLLLVGIVLSSEDVRVKLVFVMFYCFIGVSFYAVIFPAGTLGSQQSILGVTRLLYDGTVLHGWGGDAQNVFVRVFNWLDKPNFQSALAIVFARMFDVDVFGVHLFFMPVLWGIFVPSLVFLIGRTLNVGDKVAALSGFLGSAFPLLVFSGSVSVPVSLGYVFFLGALLFCLRYLVSGKSSAVWWMVVLGFAAFVSHFLAGIVSFGFVVLALAVRRYEVEKSVSLWAARFVLVVSFVIAVSLLPLALRYLSLVSPLRVYFGLDNLEGLTVGEVVGLFLVGEYFDFSPWYAVLNILGPLLGLVGVLYALRASRSGDSVFGRRVLVLFLFIGFLVTFVDYRVLKMFMVSVPFSPNRVWVFRNFVLLPFAGFVVCGVFEYLGRMGSAFASRFTSVFSRRLLGVGLRVLVLVGVSVLVVASVFSAYPQFGPLQITSYELDAVRYLDSFSNRSYVVVGDGFIDLAGGMIVGVNNPRAYYFGSSDAVGLEFFNEMKANASVDVMVTAIDYANVSIAYFVVDKLRLGEVEFDRVVSAALNNGLQMLPVSFGDGKVVVFRYERL